MGRRCRFVRPATDRLELTEGDWIEVKHQLTVGERRGVLSRAAKGGISSDGQRVHIDGGEMAFARVEAWLLDWNLLGPDDKAMKLTPDALRNMDPADFAEIEKAIDAHEEAVAQTKNSSASTDTSPSSTPTPIAIVSTETSRSVTGSVGVSTT